MTDPDFRALCARLFAETPGNALPDGGAMFDSPLLAVAAADDPLFARLKAPDAVGALHRSPREWLPDAERAVCFFFPLTGAVRAANRSSRAAAAPDWVSARMEGQRFLDDFFRALAAALELRGVRTCVPALSPALVIRGGSALRGTAEDGDTVFAASWSERHAAFIAGLGTFGLSGGLITARGMAGRLGSILVSAPLAVTPRPYTGIYEYCARCLACARRCPAGAITAAHKDHALCRARLRETGVSPRLACGLCQTAVPCEAGIPARRRDL